MPEFIIHNSLKPFPLAKDSVRLCFTSPPYWNQRNYRDTDDQIGSEETVGQYVDHMVTVGRNVKEVLTKDGSYFLNIGDKYDNKTKNLLLVPYRVALAMMDDGWILRNVIIWYKPNRMPSSFKDRLTCAYEPIFHFVKNRNYYYDLDAIRVPHETLKVERYLDNENLSAKLGKKIETIKQTSLFGIETVKKEGYDSTKLEGETDIKNIGARWGFNRYGESLENRYADGGKNPGDVFFDTSARLELSPVTNESTDPTTNSIGDHTERDAKGLWLLQSLEMACPDCGAEFQAAIDEIYRNNPDDLWEVNTQGLRDSHFAVFPPKLAEMVVKVGSKIGDTVLDPFSGSGTTAIVAESLGRKGIGVDIEFQDVRDRRVQTGIQTELVLG